VSDQLALFPTVEDIIEMPTAELHWFNRWIEEGSRTYMFQRWYNEQHRAASVYEEALVNIRKGGAKLGLEWCVTVAGEALDKIAQIEATERAQEEAMRKTA